MFKTLFALSLVAYASAECPNACSGHGSCGSFDMCTCYRNWQAADCSQRTCPFDRAHVDTPKGDLDFSLDINSSSDAVIVGSTVYPYGTVESSWPDTVDQSAHYYMECSNKGLCDRTTGECDCFDGYDGAACQRASCPNDCSGHGTCETIKQIAARTFDNVYALWDKKASMGCVCDAGYSNSDCSERQCKYGVDPLYIDDTYARNTKVTITVSDSDPLVGSIAIKFYDVFGEDYTTNFFSATTSASDTDGADICELVTNALTALPNKAVPAVDCYSSTPDDDTAWSVTLDFTSNPGYLKMPEVVTSSNGVTKLTTGTAVVSTVEIGEFTDYFATSCSTHGLVEMTFGAAESANVELTLSGTGTIAGLRKCLGDSNGDSTDNVGIENWDLPDSTAYIHVAKAIQSTQADSTYRRIENLLISSTSAVTATAGLLLFTTNVPEVTDGTYQLYSTDGTAQLVDTGAITAVAGATTITTATDASCDTSGSTIAATNCVQVGSKLFIVNKTGSTTLVNQGQMYTVVKVDTTTITLDYALTTQAGAEADDLLLVYQFVPATTGNYVYVSQCSNRGNCDTDTGLCTCFKGYTKDDCSTQSALAM